MLFSFIVPHYQGAIKHEAFCKAIESIKSQTHKDFEIICIHDGPLLDESVELPCEVQFTEERYNDWGHTLRTIGMDQAKGDYIIHTNADNIFYPNATQELYRATLLHDNPDILIYFIVMMGLNKDWGTGKIWYDNPRDYSKFELMMGYPPKYGNIDCMQLVMKKELWEKEGYWYNTTEQGDGLMYEKFGNKYDYKMVYKILGEHY